MCCKETVTWHSLLGERFEPTDKPKRVGDYILDRILGEGRCGVVREAVSQKSGKKVAVKVLVKYRARRGELQRQCFRREVESLRRVRHPNVISLYETMETARCMYLVLEHVTGGTLQHLLKIRKFLNVEEVRLFVRQLVSATNHIHRSAIIHRDIKPANILVCGNDNQIKLIDFGLSSRTESGETLGHQCGTPMYSAPEVYSGTGCGPSVDVWSLGVILHEMLTGRTPFSNERPRSLSQLHANILRAVVIPPSVHSDCAALIKSLLSFIPENRPTSSELMLDPWISQIDPLHNSALDHTSLNDMAARLELSDLNSENNNHKQCDSMGVRKLGYLPHPTFEATEPFSQRSTSVGSPGSRDSGTGGYADRRVSFANLDHEHKLQEIRDEGGDHSPDVEFSPSETARNSPYTYTNSVCKHAEKLKQVKVEDFLSACDFEVGRQRKRRCQKTQFSPLFPTECEPEEECVPCQVAQFKRDLLQRHPSGRGPDCKLCYRYRSQRATMKGIVEAKSIATPMCQKANLKDKTEARQTPPPPPVSVMAILSSPAVTPSPVGLGTPDSEYDTGKRDQLIKKYLPQRKLTHWECQPRGRVFFYTEDTVNQGVVHQPYHFQRRQTTIATTMRKRKSIATTTYSVTKLGLLFTLPNPGNIPQESHPVSFPRRWNNATLLPPIDVQKMEHVTPFTGPKTPPGAVQSRCSSATCS